MAVERIARISLTTANAVGMAAFYSEALGFEPIAVEPQRESGLGSQLERGDVTARARAVRLGKETVELVEFSRPGHPYPAERSSNDRLFQHMAIVVADMHAAYRTLSACDGWTPISAAPQLLPRSSGGARAFKFRDPEGHPLELLQFPTGSRPAWSAGAADRPFLGIDHSAIVVTDTARSIAFYELLGFSVSYRSLNQGPEQGRLDGLPGAIVEVTGLAPRGSAPPHLELLCYRAPPPRSTQLPAPATNDVAAVRLVMEVDDLARTIEEVVTAERYSAADAGHAGSESALVRDPDGHALLLRAPLA